MKTRSLLAIVLLALALALGVGTAAPASAHAELDWTVPSVNTTLKSCPSHVIMHFTEAVASGGLTVMAGTKALLAQAAVDNETFVVATAGRCGTHALALQWRTVSADDGHIASGSVSYKIGATASPATAARVLASPGTPLLGSQPAIVTFRTLGYLALAAFIGGLTFLCLVWPAGAEVVSSRRLLVVAVLMGVLSSIGQLFGAAAQTTSSYDLSGVLDQAFGREYAAMGLLWLLAGVVVVDLLQRGRPVLERFGWRFAAALVGAGLVFMEGRSAHAVQASDSGWGTVSDFLHITSMSIWVGGLFMLVACVLPRRQLLELDTVVPRFSTLAQIAVIGVVASGLFLVCEIIAPIPDFWDTRYARVLAIKLIVLSTALLAALFSKRWVDRRTEGRRSTGVRAIVLSIGAETVLALGVLAAAGTLATTSPGL